MQIKPVYKNALLDIYDFFEKKIKLLRTKGIKHNNIIRHKELEDITIENNKTETNDLSLVVVPEEQKSVVVKKDEQIEDNVQVQA